VIHGAVYDGKDRHNGEIFGFYLNLVLGFGKTPPVAGRVLNWETELRPVATSRLLATVFTKGKEKLEAIIKKSVCVTFSV
jgi:hypothetical protein